MELALELEKRQQHLCKLAKVWVTEGVYGEGFYHGDLHAGNILITDEAATIIDYGNATKLTTEQQEEVTRMMAAAAVGDMEVFRSGYHNLLKNNPAMEEKYQRCRGRLGEIIKEVFQKGDSTVTGQRIAVVLLKAQELGLEIPAAIYNFSQSQLRMQNTLQEVNDLLDQVKKNIRSLDIAVSPPAVADVFVMANQNRELMGMTRETAFLRLQGRIGLDSSDFLTMLRMKSTEGREQFDQLHMDFAKHDEDSLRKQIIFLERQVFQAVASDADPRAVTMVLNDNPAYYATRGVISMIMPDFLDRAFEIAGKDVPEKTLAPDEYADRFSAWQARVFGELEDLTELFFMGADSYLMAAESLRTQLQDIREAQDEERIGELPRMEDNFIEMYRNLQKKILRGEPFLGQMMDNLKKKEEPRTLENGERLKDNQGRLVLTTRESFELELKPWFADLKNHGKELEDAYREYRRVEALDQKDPKVQADLKKAENTFFDVYVEAVQGKMKVVIDQMANNDRTEPDSFYDVMGEVIDENLKASLSRVGFFKSLTYRFKMN